MELLELKTSMRVSTGNGPSRVLRRQGRIPAILYGPGSEPVLSSVDTGELELALKKHNAAQALFNLVIENGEIAKRTAMIKELQIHPLSRDLLHVDFYEVAMDRKVQVNVPVAASGKSPGVELGGMLQIIRRELEVSCLPHQIPETVAIDISELNIGDSVHVEDIVLAEGVEISSDINFTVLTILGAVKAEVEEGEEEEGLEGEEGAEAGAESDDATDS